MIPLAFIQAWASHAPWADLRQVEQDLIISRALCDLFTSPALKGKIAFRGGTAINKLLFKQPLRYSEDIDLVQTKAEPIGETVDAIRDALSWLGKPKRQQAGHSMHLIFKFTPEVDAGEVLNLKVEINTREHTNLYGLTHVPFAVQSDWHQGAAEIATFAPEELFGTKLRALLQRRKNRDLFDLHHGLEQLGLPIPKRSWPASTTVSKKKATRSRARTRSNGCCRSSRKGRLKRCAPRSIRACSAARQQP